MGSNYDGASGRIPLLICFYYGSLRIGKDHIAAHRPDRSTDPGALMTMYRSSRPVVNSYTSVKVDGL
ncbi:hypothetical protein PGTUg99_032296 [Puccinia graminis f. sp. tritici]|uniref:Uncharacterized protein n=1 Tax=Puccinia graminis f. sp. tritici TaxID=56615 RepID=A0A5B0RFF1_PUCGR|nr:hypothetical protein PGTUg99_032296 [Puccinia graminis f. sp. tritici]